MKKAPTPSNEQERLEAVQALKILDSPEEERFDRITRLASSIFKVPITTITLVDENREWHKSTCGPIKRQGKRSISFCGHTILSDMMIIPNTLKDPQFKDSPLVTGKSNIQFYAGVTLKSIDGQHIGTLCLKDHKPRKLSAEQIKNLRELAKWAETELNISMLKEAIELKEKVARNLQEQERAQEEYEFISTLSHQLQTPINVILWQTECLKKDDEMKEKQVIYDKAENLHKIVSRLLVYLEMRSKYIPTNKKDFNLSEAIQEIIDKRKTKIKYTHSKKPIHVFAEEDRMKTIVDYLIENAITYSGKKKKIEVDLKKRLGKVKIIVKDNGFGIPDRDIEKMFTKFFRCSNASLGKNEGSGISLYLAKIIAEAHDGTISMISKEGKGSTFTIEIPVK